LSQFCDPSVNANSVQRSTGMTTIERIYDVSVLTCVRVVLALVAAFFAAIALGTDYVFGEDVLGLYFSEKLGFMYWVDVIPHVCGGAAVGLAFACTQSWGGLVSKTRLCGWAVASALVVGGLWEMYESLKGYDALEIRLNTPAFNFHAFNDVKDLMMDSVGAFLIARFVAFTASRSLNTETLRGSAAA
jgi:hypothetical protein